MAKYGLFCIGEIVIDFMPVDNGRAYAPNPGGAPANVAIAATRLGAKAAFCGKVGRDDFGRMLHDTLRANGVEPIAAGPCDQAVTTRVFVTVTDSGERSFTCVRKPGADMFLGRDDVDIAALADSAIVHAGSCSLSADVAADATMYAMSAAHKLGKLVSFDVNYRAPMWSNDSKRASESVRKLLPLIDLLKISDEEAFLLGGEAALPQLMLDNDISLIAVTRGADGASVYYGGSMLGVAGMKADVADTNGAGDAFWAGCLTSLLEDGVLCPRDLDETKIRRALELGNVAGWLTVQKSGAIPALPSRSSVDKYINRGERI